MSDVQVQVRRKCDTCEGAGVVLDAIWDEFYEWHRAHAPRDLGPEAAAEEIAAQIHAQDEAERQWWRARGYGKPPAEEMQCCDCDGTGQATRWVPVAELAKLLLDTEVFSWSATCPPSLN